jgi:hypothetical protein
MALAGVDQQMALQAIEHDLMLHLARFAEPMV